MARKGRQVIERRMQNSFEKYEWTEEQRKRFEDFVEERFANYSNPVNTILLYLAVLNHVVEQVKKPFSDMTVEDLIPILQEWQENSPATTHGWRSKLRAFFRWESDDKHDPRAEKIRAGTYVSPIKLDDLLTENEIKRLRQAAKDNPRDLAMLDFHILWGPRPAESAGLNVGHVQIVENRYIIVNIPETKTTARPVPLPLAKVSFVQDPVFLDSALNAYVSMMKYLDVHPGYPHEPDTPLWYDMNNGYEKRLTSVGVTAVFKRLGKAAQLKRSVTSYVLRRTAFNRFKGADREKLNAGFGWKPGSRMSTTVYNKLRPQDVLGTLIKDESAEPRNVYTCSQCQKENPEDQTFCVWCGAPLVELPAAATLEQFHADSKTQKEFGEMKEKMDEIEKMLKVMVQLPGFDKFLKEAANKPS
jgi:site-specific recombinase XerD